MIAATPSGSTAYNLSNGGPVLVWGLDALVVTFIAPHSLHARPLVVPRSSDLVVQNKTADVALTVLADGHPVGELGAEEHVDDPARPEAHAARDPAGSDVLHPLPRHLCFVA